MRRITLLMIGSFITSFLFAQSSIIKVTDFGALPGDNKDDTPAIISAVKACKHKKNPKLVFESGSYDIYGSQKNERGNFMPAIEINSINGLTIEGNGSELIGHNYSTMFHFTGCRNMF